MDVAWNKMRSSQPVTRSAQFRQVDFGFHVMYGLHGYLHRAPIIELSYLKEVI